MSSRGSVQDGLGQAHPLAIALTQLADGPGEVIGQAHIVDRLCDALRLVGLGGSRANAATMSK